MITIDGSAGEGGGQVLRTCLTLAIATGQAFRITDIRAKRKKPGLLRQHLTAVNAATQISGAKVGGDALGSTELTFTPGAVRGGSYRFAIGSAGSAVLVLQTLIPALALAAEPSEVIVEGGTHNPLAPTFDYLKLVYAPLLARMGVHVELTLERPGFFPAGGGRIVARIRPVARFTPLELVSRGEIRTRQARALVAHLPLEIAQRELAVVEKRLGWSGPQLLVEEHRQSLGPGNVLSLSFECEHLTELFTAFGERDVSAENVADDAVKQARDWLASGVPVGEHMADQLLVPFALAGAGTMVTQRLTSHSTTNVDVVKRFLPVEVKVTPLEQRCVRVEVCART